MNFVTYDKGATTFLRREEMQYLAQKVLEQIPENVQNTQIHVTVKAIPRSRNNDLETVVDYIRSGGHPSPLWLRNFCEAAGLDEEAERLPVEV